MDAGERAVTAAKPEGLMREIVRHVQIARKSAGLQVDDRIRLALHSDDEDVMSAINAHSETIEEETLANTIGTEGSAMTYHAEVKVEGSDLSIGLEKSTD